jgi:hypothetical protein
MNISDLIPEKVKVIVLSLADKVDALLQGETLRMIQYGGAVLLYVFARILGVIPDVSFAEAVAQTVAASAIVIAFVESARHFVYSPATVAAIVTTPPTAAGPIAAAEAAGVDTTQAAG